MSPSEDVVVFPSVECPWCGFTLDHAKAGPSHKKPPRDGDGVVCLGCAMPSMIILGPVGIAGLRRPTADELIEFAARHGDLVRAVHEYHLNYRRRHNS